MKPKILLQLDTDLRPSSFDAVVAIDAGVDHLLQYGGISRDNVESLVHGAIFTRSPNDLQSTAIFIGGADLQAGEAVLQQVVKTMFDPLRVSVVLDSNGANSTACAAVLTAMKHLDLAGTQALILGATGAVGKRVCMLLAQQGAKLGIGSREITKAKKVADEIASDSKASSCEFVPFAYDDVAALNQQLSGCELLVACGAAGVQLLSRDQLEAAKNLKVAIDLNAVSPAGLEGIGAMDKAEERVGRCDYGALAVGGLKMKIHKAAIRTAFQQRGVVLDALEMLEIGQGI